MDEHDLHAVTCPWCLETIEMPVDPGAGEARWVEDCPVCCHPIELGFATGPGGKPQLTAERSH